MKYWPFGSTRSGDEPSDKAYTQQQKEPGSLNGAYYYKARFYSTTLGRFMSADPLTVDGYNRYQYVRGNPLRYTDPTGMPDSAQDLKDDVYRLKAVFDAGLTSPELVWRAQYCSANPADCQIDPSCDEVTGCNDGAAPAPGSVELTFDSIVLVPLGVAAADTGACMAVTDGACAPIVVPVAFATGGAIITRTCIAFCPDAYDAARSGVGNLVDWAKGGKGSPEGIPGASRGRGGIINLPDGTYLERNRQTRDHGKAHQGEGYEQQDPRNQRHRGVVVRDGKVIPVQDWKQGNVGKP